MLSRVAASVYWLNRYVERAENVARYVDVNLSLLLDLPGDATTNLWRPLVAVTGDSDRFEDHFGAYNGDNVIKFLIFDPDNPNSVLSSLHYARENARQVRETISSEMWEQVNTFHMQVRDAAFQAERVLATPHRFLQDVKMNSHLFAGVRDATMSHGEPWQFGRLGQWLERADKTSRIIDMKYFILLPDPTYVGSPYDSIQWAAVLRSASALEMYRKKHGRVDPVRVADFLLLDQGFPRAIRYCIRRAEESLHAIAGSPVGSFQNVAEQRLGRLRADLDYTRIQEIVTEGLHEFLDGLQLKLNRIGEAIFETFFALAPEEDHVVGVSQ